MKTKLSLLFLLPALLLLAACSSDPSISPTGALISGNLKSDEYLGAVKKANEATNEQELFEANRVPTRAYNTNTGKFEYVPEDTEQFWNEKTKRWEFTPVVEK